MPAKYEILRTVDEDSASALYVAREKKKPAEIWFRRFKTRKVEEIEGLKELHGQLATLDSPHVEKPLDFGTDKEGFFVTFTPQEGETLEQALLRGPLTAEEFEILALQMLTALDLLHDQAVVHGSIRPDYIRILGSSRKDWRMVLGGFGQGFAVREDSKEAQIRAYRCTAPEQWQDGTTRRRTDVYALGCVLYEALAARAPFDGRALKELRLKHISHDLAPLQKLASHVPAWMCAWVMHLLAADPEQRPRKASAARELFEKREAPKLPELGPRSEAPKGPITPATTPPVTLAQAPPPQSPPPSSAPHPVLTPPPVSAPVILPAAQAMVRNVTSSTIPIASSPRPPSAGAVPRKPGQPAVPSGGAGAKSKSATGPTVTAPRQGFTPPRRPPTAITAGGAKKMKKDLKPVLIPAATVLVLLALFGLSRCGLDEKPGAGKPAAAKKK